MWDEKWRVRDLLILLGLSAILTGAALLPVLLPGK